MTEFKYVGRHVDDLADGRVVEPGQSGIELDELQQADPHNAQRIQAGLLIPVQHAMEADATDEARTLAAEHGIDLHDVTGTGKDGRIIKADVEAHIEKKEGND